MDKTANNNDRLSLEEMNEYLFNGKKVEITDDQKNRVAKAYEFLSDFSNDSQRSISLVCNAFG